MQIRAWYLSKDWQSCCTEKPLTAPSVSGCSDGISAMFEHASIRPNSSFNLVFLVVSKRLFTFFFTSFKIFQDLSRSFKIFQDLSTLEIRRCSRCSLGHGSPGALAEALHGIPAVPCAQRTATGGGAPHMGRFQKSKNNFFEKG